MPRIQDNYVNNDRKLRPIFDCLDNGCYKKALQEIDKLLKKNKDSQYLKVLKSLTLIRMARKKDAAELLLEVHNEVPVDDTVLQTMSMCYREIQRNDLIVSIYENALKKDPTNEKLFTHLFMAYVRLQEYKKQQITALNLYKVHPKNPYYFWAVMSIYMQAIVSQDKEMASKIVLPLAEKMCEKFFKEKKFETDAEYDLYLMILEKQQKYSNMIELIDYMRENYLMKDDFNFQLHRKAQLLRYENRLSEAFHTFKDLIQMNNDQYCYYIEAFEIAKLLLEKQSSDTNGTDPSESNAICQLLELIEQMCSLGKTTICSLPELPENSLYETVSKRCPRGPFMARIIIFDLIHKQNLQKCLSKDLPNLNDLLCQYHEEFGSKYVCIKDLIFMLQKINLNTDQIQDLIMKIKFSLMNLEDPEKNGKNMCYNYLEHYCRSSFTENLRDRFNEAFSFYKLNETKEHEPFDSLVYLFVISALGDCDIYQSNDASLSSVLFDLIVFLECYLTNNKTDFYTKLILVCLYHAIGAALSSHALYESLEIKLIQNDTLGFYFLPSFIHCGLYFQAQNVLNLSSKFYNFNFKEASDYIISCYKNGSFSKIEEIINFNYKLRNSIQYNYSFIEKFYIEILTDCKNESSFSNFAEECTLAILTGNFDPEWEKICDNRDFQLLNAHNHIMNPHIDDTLKPQTLFQETLWLKFRFTMLKTLVVGYQMSKKICVDEDISKSEDVQSLVETEKISLSSFETMVKSLKELVEKCKCQSTQKLNYCLESPPPSRMNVFFAEKYYLLMLILFDHLLYLFRLVSNPKEYENNDSSINDPENLLDELSKESLDLLKTDKSLKGMYRMLGKLNSFVEVLSISVFLYSLIENNIRKFSKPSKRSKKKSSHQIKENEIILNKFNGLISIEQKIRQFMEDNFKKLSEIFNDVQESYVGSIIDGLQCQYPEKIENDEVICENVRNNIRSSYNKSLNEINNIIQIKYKYLLSI